MSRNGVATGSCSKGMAAWRVAPGAMRRASAAPDSKWPPSYPSFEGRPSCRRSSRSTHWFPCRRRNPFHRVHRSAHLPWFRQSARLRLGRRIARLPLVPRALSTRACSRTSRGWRLRFPISVSSTCAGRLGSASICTPRPASSDESRWPEAPEGFHLLFTLGVPAGFGDRQHRD